MVMDLSNIAKHVGNFASAFGPIGSAVGVIGSLFGASSDRAAQAKENEKNRQFNAEQAQLSRDYNTEMWNKTNEYNSPKAMMERLMSAGLNPMLAYGSLDGGSASMQSSPGASMGATPSGSNFAGAFANAGQLSMQSAQTSLIQAQTRKTEAEAETQEIDNKYEDLLKSQQFQSGNVMIHLNETLASEHEASTRIIIEDLNNYGLKLDNIRSQIWERLTNASSNEQKILFQKLENYIKASTTNEVISHIASEARISKANADLAYRLISSSILLNLMSAENQSSQSHVGIATVGNLYSQRDKLEQEVKNLVVEANNAQLFGTHLSIENDALQFKLDQDKAWDDWERGFNLFNTTVSSIGSAVGGFGFGLNQLRTAFPKTLPTPQETPREKSIRYGGNISHGPSKVYRSKDGQYHIVMGKPIR